MIPPSIPFAQLPSIRVLGNGTFTTVIHASGGGFSRCRGLALNDWNGDVLAERGGLMIYVRDLETGETETFGTKPAVLLSEAIGNDPQVATLSHAGAGLELEMNVWVSADHDVEVRSIKLRNTQSHPRQLQVTVALPVALNHPSAHAAHPAFSKLFVQTEFIAAQEALLARRRPRGDGDPSPCMVAQLLGQGTLDWETDRAKFLGRGRSLQEPLGLESGLTGCAGNVLDPAFILQRTAAVDGFGETEFTFLLGATENREAALKLLDASFPKPTATANSAHAKEQCLAQSLAGAMFYRLPLIAAPSELRQKATGHAGLVWAFGLPTDRPFAVLMTNVESEVAWMERTVVYWKSLGLDLPVIVLGHGIDAVGEGIHFRKLSEVSAVDRAALLAVAAFVCGNLCDWKTEHSSPLQPIHAAKTRVLPRVSSSKLSAENLLMDNSLGGFSQDGREYVIRLHNVHGRLVLPPVPWINVLANPRFGCLVSEVGAGCTWSRNSRERRLTPWSNDPVLDPHDDALYLRDEANGALWSPLPGPIPSGGDFEVRHGFGRTTFLHVCQELRQETTVFVHASLPVKFTRVVLENLSSQEKSLSLVSYQRLVLGFLPEQSAQFVEVDVRRPAPDKEPSGQGLVTSSATVLTARNPIAGEFADGVTFATCVTDAPVEYYSTLDRRAFLGAMGDVSMPESLHGRGPITHSPTVSDPCFVQQVMVTLPPGQKVAIHFLLGECQSDAEVHQLLAQFTSEQDVLHALNDVSNFWQETLGRVQIKTPVPAIDVMVNGWLLYQTLACRMWGRTAFYQSSGAYGFRDQLQDSGSLVYARPDLTRRQLLIHAARQFSEGDVLHWWHEAPLDRGLRTRFSDDLNWLPLLTALYVRTTGDAAVLDEQIPFLKARLLEPGEDESYLKPEVTDELGDLYEHCCRALDRSLTKGIHGLPLMGTGDWNDGMNRVGREGKGESVWMGFFLYQIITEFLPLCQARQDQRRIDAYTAYQSHLSTALNEAGWDGAWYRRAYYDDGTPLGSAGQDECRIDVLAQAWAVISKAAPASRAAQAMQAVEDLLIDDAGKLIRLLTPAFVNTPHDPGYIKGYVAGVRENGGQYTHAACWVVRAMAELGRTDRAAALLEMLCPASHATTREQVEVYKTEPFVVVADVYGEPPHVGRGGWSWYTGSAGWLYRVALESVLGITMENGDTLVIHPCIPPTWPSFEITWKWHAAQVRIHIKNGTQGNTVRHASLNGIPAHVENGIARVTIPSSGREHLVEIQLS